MKKIYFAGSIRGGRVDAALYGRIIEYLQKTSVVLTEHVGSPHLNLMEQGKRDVEIYDQDTAWLRESDILIGECTCPSLGVGYELAYAERFGKPCHIFYDRTKTQLSAMLTGNPYFHIHPYADEAEIYAALDQIVNSPAMSIPEDLKKYIYEEIVPRYAAFDKAHREDHALTVTDQAMKLLEGRVEWLEAHPDADPMWRGEVAPSVLFAAAACHDLGLVNGRERHHLDSGVIIRADRRLRDWFDEDEIETIAQAAEDHRASGKSAPRSIYGMLVAEADRVIDGDTIILRTIQYGMKNYPELDRQGHIERAVAHLREKYGYGGYLRLWIPWSDNAVRLNALREIIADDVRVREVTAHIYDSEI